MSWYENIYVKVENKKNSVKKIIEWINENYFYDSEMLSIDEKDNSFVFEGAEHLEFYKKGESKVLPDIVELFKGISIEFLDYEYSAEAKIRDNRSGENQEYSITCQKNILKIETPLLADVCYMDDYEDYDEFCDTYDEIISRKKFNKYKENDEIVYICERKVYTEEEYYNNCSVIFCESIENIIRSQPKNMNEEQLLCEIEKSPEFMKKVPKKLRNNRDFILNAVRKNGFSIIYLNNELANDKKIATEAVKNDPYVVGFLSEELRVDEELNRISEDIRKTYEEEN